MTTNTTLKIGFDDPSVYDFLTGLDKNYTHGEPAHEGFSEVGRQVNPYSEEAAAQTIPYLVTETYQVIQRTSVAGIVTATVVLAHEVGVTPIHVLYLRDGLDAETKTRAISLLNVFEKNDGDFSDWLRKQLNGDWIKEDDFRIDIVARLEKVTDEPLEIDVRQRDSLYQLYGIKKPSMDAVFRYPGSDTKFDFWAQNRGTTLRKIDSQAVSIKGSSKPETSLVVHELKPNEKISDAEVNNIVTLIVSKIVPSSCGVTKSEKFPLLSVSNWPEFKLEWIVISVKIGCSRVSFSVPILRTRNAKMVVYVRYERPKDIELTVLEIVKTCAIRGALVGTVVGIILVNPAAALVAFETAFKDCVKEEVVACLHPGVFLVKEVSDWK